MTEQKRINNSFEFIGEIAIPKDKNKFSEVKVSESGWESLRLSIAVKESRTNSVFIEVQGGKWKDDKKNKEIKTKSKENTDIIIPYKDRLKQSNIDLVADYRKTVIDLETDLEKKDKYMKLYFQIRALQRRENLTDEDKKKLDDYITEYDSLSENRHEFINNLDFVEFIKDNIGKFAGRKVKVRGNIKPSEWKGKFYYKYEPQSIEFVDSETPSELSAKLNVYYGKNSLDVGFREDLKKLFLNGYIKDYDRSVSEDRFFERSFIVNLDKIDPNNELHKAMVDKVFVENLTPEGDTYVNLLWEVAIYRGAETKEFTEDDLTQKQRDLISFGLNTIDDFKPKGGILGNNVDEYRLVKPILKDEFKEGALDTCLTEDEFLEKVAKNTADIKVADIKKDKEESKKVEAATVKEEKTEDLLKNLFG